ncbi:hypothetical protein COU75_01600 [Candidatus Peregrinibacteria bacterium CG10_big_fil_rev_8_21_14_0_10_42_8]|nr:MAG: hypothetical protein COU75_01600 [Candidatus Peregrinibacteria bacterium CG10_big_fil_rev_8_21_14_0_10_42_8]
MIALLKRCNASFGGLFPFHHKINAGTVEPTEVSPAEPVVYYFIIRGTIWRSSDIAKKIPNSVYRGDYISNRYRRISLKPELYEERPEEDWIHMKVEPCIDDRLFYMAQERLRTDFRRGRGGGSEIYMLKGKLVDVATGKGFVGYKAADGNRHYRRKKFTDDDGNEFKTMSVSGTVIEDYAWGFIKATIEKPEEFLRLHKESMDDQTRREELIRQLDFYEEQLSKANNRIERTKDAYLEDEEEILKESDVKHRLTKYEAQRDEALINKKKVETELQRIAQYDVACEDLRRFSAKFEKKLNKATYEEKKVLADLLIEKIEVCENEDERKAIVHFRFDPNAITRAIPDGRSDNSQDKGKKPPSGGGETKDMVKCTPFGRHSRTP